MRGAEQKRAAYDEGKTSKAGAGGRELRALERERERLRAELAAERERVKRLEDVNNRVTARLDRAIASVKAILSRQS